MKDRPTPETDAFFCSFADGDATPSHEEYYDRMRQLERERDEAREWKNMLSGWGGTPEIVHEFIKGQQARIHAAQDIERERDEAREEVKRIQHWATLNGTIQMHRELTELTKQRDALAEAAKLIADEYEDRRCQFGGDPLWIKHEQGSAIENALAIINEHHHE